jgi:predicted O-methyltransferase YrrM
MTIRRKAQRLRDRARNFEDAPGDSIAMQALATLPGSFLPWTSFAMRPEAILAILTDIEINERKALVECGSGNSTVYSARLLRVRGEGHLTSIDNDPDWAALTRRLLEREGLSEWATVVDAPLVNGWYDKTKIPAIADVDLLVVDGPPAFRADIRRAREEALDHFAGQMTLNSTVILDDARRKGEQIVMEQWTDRHGRKFRTERGGHAISAPHTS